MSNKLVLLAIENGIKAGKDVKQIKAELREADISDTVIDNCIEKYLEYFNHDNKDDALVDRNRKFEEWYGGANESENSHWSKLKSILITKKGWSKDMINSLNSSSNSVVSKLANPKLTLDDSETNQIKGLVLGYVQSGKTANYSAVISKALDAGYKFIIVLAGIHNNLRYQTEVRLREEIVKPSELMADPITRMDEKGDFNEKLTQSANRVLGGSDGFGIAVLKKNASVLRKFNTWLSKAKPEILANTSVLIIDDESDQASINTSTKPEEKQTAINKQIRNIISHFPSSSYAGYTATPFANILIDSNIEEDLFPKDFIISLSKPVSYIGAEELFGAQDTEGNINMGYPLVRTIDEMDAAQISASKRGQEKEYDSLPPSLEYAIDCFIVAGAIRISRGHNKNHISMLVHGSYLTKDQSKVHELIEDHVGLLKSDLRREIEETRDRILKIKEEEFDPTSEEITGNKNQISKHDLFRNIKLFLEQFQIILDNSASDERLSFEENFKGIVVGGNTLSRGLTIEGLTISYFIRNSKMYDSLMQMGRWFGYRPGYLDLKRIFITDELRDHFYEMATSEIALREELSVMAENGDTPMDFRVRVRQHPGMKLTAANKMRTANTEANSFSGRRALPDFIRLHDKKTATQNRDAVENLLTKLTEQQIKKQKESFSMFRTSHTYRGVEKELILQFLDEYFISEANTLANKSDLIEYISKNTNLTDWSVSIFSLIKNGDSHKFKNGDEIILLDRSFVPDVKKPADESASYLRGLYLPKDEMIDLRDLFDTDNIVEVLKDDNDRRIGTAKIRMNQRPKNRALLAIYPLSNNSKSQERTGGVYHLKPIKCKDIQFGIMIVFPDNKEFGKQKYIVNSTI
ncbi:Z1 domain-containing protein [Halobacteriovorax sp.]|uniref:Z1 domain-containing protein n=1 Tax=Halobacteriovorax sp. TaxID=2020862 RepID=UPI003AF2B7E0